MHKHIMELSLLHASWTQGDALSVSEALTDRKTELFARNFFFFFFFEGLRGKELKNVSMLKGYQAEMGRKTFSRLHCILGLF